MKRILSVILSVVVLLSALCLVSCDEKAVPVESINGMTGEEACMVAFANLAMTEKYHVSVDAKLLFNVMVASVPVGIDGFYDYTLDGEDMHYKFTDKDLLFIDNEKLLSIFAGYDKEVWYVDGVRYSINSEGEKVLDDSGRKPSNVVDKIINTITADAPKAVECYEVDGEQFVLMQVELEEFNAGLVNCRVFIDDNNEVTKAEVDGKLYGVNVVLTMNFEYDGIEGVSAPKNIDEFIEK